jgi:hypothetical protein
MPDTTQINDPEEIFSQAKTGLIGKTKTENKSIHDFDLEVSPNDRLMDGKLAYDKFGFYFHFYGKEKYKYQHVIGLWLVASTASQGTDKWRVEYKYEYLRKGNGQTLQTGEGTLKAPPIGSLNKIDTTFYSGSRGLKNGYALWTVWNDQTDYVKVQRNYVGEYFINYRATPLAMPNYDLDVLDFNLAKPYFISW